MTVSSAPAGTATTPKRRRFPWRVILIALAVIIVIPLATYFYIEITTRNALAEAQAEARADLPRWRLLEIDEDRPDVPAEENSALHIIATVRKGAGMSVGGAPNYDEIFAKLPPNAQLNLQQERIVRDRLGLAPAALENARKLKDMPRGRFPIKYNDDFISTLLPNHQDARTVCDWLEHDAMLLVHDGDPDRALESCHAILNAGRGFDGEPFLIPHLIRVALQHRAIQSIERVLAQGEPADAGMLKLQAALEKEGRESSWLPSMRGERAGFNHLMENIQNGKISTTSTRGLFSFGGGGGSNVNRVGLALAEVYPRSLLKYYPDYLKHMNRMVDAAKLPYNERLDQMNELENECKTTGNILVRLLMPAVTKVGQADARSQALLRATAVALACERYRLAKNQWPESLDVLVQAKFMEAIPLDPFDGKSLRYRRTKEGAVVYSVGVDQKDDGGTIDFERMHEPGKDVGVRLFNVGERRGNPLPPVIIQKND